MNEESKIRKCPNCGQEMHSLKKRRQVTGGIIAAIGGLILGQAVVFLSGRGPINPDTGRSIDMTNQGIIGLIIGIALVFSALRFMLKSSTWICKNCKTAQLK